MGWAAVALAMSKMVELTLATLRAKRVERRASRGRLCHQLNEKRQRGEQRRAQTGTGLSAANMARAASRSGTGNKSK
eukprot:5882304-Pyramimonas_sp.AAC.1